MSLSPQQIGAKRNRLLTYLKILEIYKEHKTPYNTVIGVYREHIKPVYPIGKVTLYKILGLPVKRELERLDELERKIDEQNEQLSMFGD